MRRPCVPMVQSKGEEAGVKLARRVTVTDKEGSSEAVMGEKRVSSKALAFERRRGGEVRFDEFFFGRRKKKQGWRGSKKGV